MVTVLQRKPSFGEQIGSGIGAGFSSGLASGAQEASRHKQMLAQIQAKELAKIEGKQKLYDLLYGKNPQPEERFGDQMAPQEMGEDFSRSVMKEPQQNEQPYSDKQIEVAAMFDPNVARQMQEANKASFRREQFEHGKRKEERDFAYKETAPYRTEIDKQARSAKDLEPVLSQMENLINNGKLTNPVIAKLADKFGVVGLLDPKSQQFNALSIGFLKDAKNIFGARVTNYDLQTYLDKIPRLVQTDQGKKALIDNFKTLGKASKLKKQAANEIIKQNGGIPPIDLEERVEEKVAPEMEKLASEFNKSFIESSRSPSGKIRMRNPNGQLGEVSESDVQKAIQKGYSLE